MCPIEFGSVSTGGDVNAFSIAFMNWGFSSIRGPNVNGLSLQSLLFNGGAKRTKFWTKRRNTFRRTKNGKSSVRLRGDLSPRITFLYVLLRSMLLDWITYRSYSTVSVKNRHIFSLSVIPVFLKRLSTLWTCSISCSGVLGKNTILSKYTSAQSSIQMMIL